jgi:uncharacterized protein
LNVPSGARAWPQQAQQRRTRVRIVLDTNVALSALLEELADVLTRSSPAKRLAVIGKTAQAVLADYVEIVDVVAPTEVPRVVPGDADNDHVIVAARAELIVIGDRKHLLPIGSHQGIAVVIAREVVERVEAIRTA